MERSLRGDPDPPRTQHPREDFHVQSEPYKQQQQQQQQQQHQQQHQHQVPAIIRDNVPSNQDDRVAPVSSQPVEQQQRKQDHQPLPTTARDETPAPAAAAGHSERPRFNLNEGRIYLGRVDWTVSKSDLVKLCEKYVDFVFGLSYAVAL
jgi:hypothetical protein